MGHVKVNECTMSQSKPDRLVHQDFFHVGSLPVDHPSSLFIDDDQNRIIRIPNKDMHNNHQERLNDMLRSIALYPQNFRDHVEQTRSIRVGKQRQDQHKSLPLGKDCTKGMMHQRSPISNLDRRPQHPPNLSSSAEPHDRTSEPNHCTLPLYSPMSPAQVLSSNQQKSSEGCGQMRNDNDGEPGGPECHYVNRSNSASETEATKPPTMHNTNLEQQARRNCDDWQAVEKCESTSRLGEFSIVQAIGKGCFSTVYQAQRKSTQEPVALKMISLSGLTSERARSKCLREIKLLQNVNHPNIIKYHESFIQGTTLCIVLEWAGAGDLKQMLQQVRARKARLHERVIWTYFVQICQALQHMHERRMIHRDVKPANVFMLPNGRVKLGDLGLGRSLSDSTLKAYSKVGTPLYMSPEVLRGAGQDFKSDIWSLGCVLYEMAMLSSPFEGTGETLQQLFQNIIHGKFPTIPFVFSQSLRTLVYTMLNLVVDARPCIQVVAATAQQAYKSLNRQNTNGKAAKSDSKRSLESLSSNMSQMDIEQHTRFHHANDNANLEKVNQIQQPNFIDGERFYGANSNAKVEDFCQHQQYNNSITPPPHVPQGSAIPGKALSFQKAWIARNASCSPVYEETSNYSEGILNEVSVNGTQKLDLPHDIDQTQQPRIQRKEPLRGVSSPAWLPKATDHNSPRRVKQKATESNRDEIAQRSNQDIENQEQEESGSYNFYSDDQCNEQEDDDIPAEVTIAARAIVAPQRAPNISPLTILSHCREEETFSPEPTIVSLCSTRRRRIRSPAGYLQPFRKKVGIQVVSSSP